MAYQWTSNAAQTVTTDPTIDVSPCRRPESTVAAAIEQFIAAAQIGATVNRSGRPYRPSALRDVRGILEYHIAPDLGRMRLRDVRRSDVQMLVERLAADGLSESRIRSVISALRALYGYAIDRGYVEFNPADGLVMPTTGAHRATRREPTPQAARISTPPMVDTVTQRDPPRQRRARERGRPAAEPGSGLPDRVLSLALRAALVLFVLVVLVSLLAPI